MMDSWAESCPLAPVTSLDDSADMIFRLPLLFSPPTCDARSYFYVNPPLLISHLRYAPYFAIFL